MGELRTGRLCENSDIQERPASEEHERGAGRQSKIPQTVSKRIWKTILQTPVGSEHRMHSGRSLAHPPDLQQDRGRRGYHQGPVASVWRRLRSGARRSRRKGHRGIYHKISGVNRGRRPQGGRIEVFALQKSNSTGAKEDGDLRMEDVRQSKNSKGILFGQIYVRRGSQHSRIQIPHIYHAEDPAKEEGQEDL